MLKSVKFWLIVSVCLNFLLIGLFAGGAMQTKHMKGKRAGAPVNEVMALVWAMPKETRRGIIRTMRKEGKRGSSRADIGLLADLVDAEPFDRDAVQDYFERHRAANDGRVATAQNALLEALGTMSDAERDKMAKKMREMPRHPRRDGGKGLY